MVSLQAALSPKEKSCLNLEDMASKKRKRDHGEEKSYSNVVANEEDIELHLDAPLPLGWQRCLDIKSGKIHFYNTSTSKRTSKDPSHRPKQATLLPGLDLDLNLTCDRLETQHNIDQDTSQDSSIIVSNSKNTAKMVAAVCMKCHILVMMCKPNLSCPNCKFMHHKLAR